MTTTVPPGLAELTEIMAYADFATSASASVREALGVGSLQVGSTRALAIREDPSNFFNRAGGFGAEQYAVWAGERIVAVGSVFLNGECADMFGGATLPEARGRGAQSALLTARVRAATAEGCRWLVAETGVEGPGEHNPSLHNMVRVGFEPLYERATWLWRA
ncbi:hypothetical protein HRW07_03590 [Streptomyces lunaelactis]|uniref:GNAT family N-acetyltransferase n=1 Tax=Streptomyces lunaelactis TaxID=1535768 RepID=UPI001584F781|nr:GNAT family N-acetyltransferase [Streptomyces lunaelactis]NUL02342.1 hypothetical protein [Streptomyces lunaelactis]